MSLNWLVVSSQLDDWGSDLYGILEDDLLGEVVKTLFRDFLGTRNLYANLLLSRVLIGRDKGGSAIPWPPTSSLFSPSKSLLQSLLVPFSPLFLISSDVGMACTYICFCVVGDSMFCVFMACVTVLVILRFEECNVQVVW